MHETSVWPLYSEKFPGEVFSELDWMPPHTTGDYEIRYFFSFIVFLVSFDANAKDSYCYVIINVR